MTGRTAETAENPTCPCDECDGDEAQNAELEARVESWRKPRWVDLFGIDPDFTDGKPVDEWLDESRGEA